ncbi:hypothetical protein GE21DRAFT_4909 [Neurospora crassa]|uniref:HMG box domain-containing protein n=1 Tax=Neurospora crassa (strain ATCC 24698 / 74-OR23-1A / CBS 708.71 / DSM 1257 / FGSC 987) TaxID=367110 RepID=Q7S1Y5_NEUCR|nr:hypothetical protein NCU07568 [Neurospora crassa OR74A]EAA29377.2 hypothetical protein NCU07568 [Neurospora crassa OR74A]KHE81682.1 hypothetical protein GE21DRAFT_4909 [Neurospora crassa]|eukprot:XP_958613.2 hypothetical protein NCU07568 [Neurospora crassa OR74A]
MAPASSVPPQLPPSVEEAYRRKCIQLKQRTTEVEEANDAARLRLARLKRQVEKMRLERAFLLEQLAKRTSTNVEDSDGSPSPPPTPKEKPLRIKRGHRKPSAMPNLDLPTAAGATFINQNLQTQSPSSDAFSAAQPTNGLHKGTLRPLKPSSAFELYCDDKRAASKEKAAVAKAAAAAAASKEAAEGSGSPEDVDNDNENENNGDITDVEEETLSREWKDLPEDRRKEFEDRADRDAERYKKEKDAYDAAKAEEEEAAANAEKAAASASAEAEATDKPSGSSKSNIGKTDDAEGATAEEMDVDADADAETTDERKASSAKAGEEGTDTPRATQEDVEMANNDTDQETKAEQPQ